MAETTPIYLDEFKAMHPADLADRLQRMQTEEARHILTELPVDAASAALAELEDEWIAGLLEEFPQSKLVPLLNKMYAEEAADVLGEIPGHFLGDGVLDLDAFNESKSNSGAFQAREDFPNGCGRSADQCHSLVERQDRIQTV